ncbi:MAG: winged helix-turn-helix transcriptional regulator [candidate division WOR-3 bacterium]|nr:MAG: winged helix-turn-helix transcriptional regulator [candidate division WOR-3 bacterium]
MAKKRIPENRYRASRICRALGNPTAYEVLTMLQDQKRTPEELSGELGVSISAVSQVLRVLRNLDLVRYEVRWRSHHYWIKTNRVVKVMEALERLVNIIEHQV